MRVPDLHFAVHCYQCCLCYSGVRMWDNSQIYKFDKPIWFLISNRCTGHIEGDTGRTYLGLIRKCMQKPIGGGSLHRYLMLPAFC